MCWSIRWSQITCTTSTPPWRACRPPAAAAAELSEQLRAHLLEALPPDADVPLPAEYAVAATAASVRAGRAYCRNRLPGS
jgi:hypothetical protein